MEIVIGVALALGVATFATLVGFDRDRAFYPVVMIVIAGLEVLFATINGGASVVALETSVMVAFVVLAVAGFKHSLWWVVIALAGHGLFDIAHPHLFTNPGIPAWWPDFCMAYDVAAAAVLATRLWRPRHRLKKRPT